jgi:SAM-dependent methyltransferase
VTQDRMTLLFFELFSGLPRQGPGDTASTQRALALVPNVGPTTRVLDLGCGTGAQTCVLAQHSPARIVAIDNHAPFIDELRVASHRLAIADRIDARVADMHGLDFAPGSFDVIWCEGALAIMGVEAGLRNWRSLLTPGGHLAFTEVCWIKPDPPAACVSFWDAEYPAIRDVPSLLTVIDEHHYDVVGHFVLPASSWWDQYYEPLQRSVREFRARHRGESDAAQLADQVQREIDIWHAHSDFYSYVFFVIRSRP